MNVSRAMASANSKQISDISEAVPPSSGSVVMSTRLVIHGNTL